MGDRRAPHPGDRATTLLLFPAAILVVLALGAITIDLSALHGARRRAERVVTAVADDAAAVIDVTALRRGLPPGIEMTRARIQALSDLAEADLPGTIVGTPQITPGPRPATIVVEVTLRMRRGLAGLIPGAPDHEQVRVRAVGELLEGP